MDNLQIDVNFLINNPEIKAASNQAKAEISGIADVAESAGKRISENMKPALKPDTTGMISDLKNKLAEARKVAESAMNETSISLANAKIQEYEKELKRLAVIGKQGLDDMKPAMKPDTTGMISDLKNKLAEARKVAESAMNETSISLANAKIQEYETQLQRLAMIGKQGFDEMGNKIAEAVEKPVGKLQRLQKVAELYANMSATSNNPETIVKYNRKLQETQVLINQTQNIGKVGFDKMGNAIQNSGSLLSKLWSGLYQVANILPGLGIAGILAFALDPLIAYVSKLDLFKEKLTDAQKANKALGNSLAEGGEYAKAVTAVTSLRVNIDLAKDGLYSKKKVIEEYNKSLGSVAGQVKTLDDVEKSLVKNADNYVKMTLYKAAAEEVLQEAGKKAADAAKKRAEDESESRNKYLSLNIGVKDGKRVNLYQEKAKADREAAAKAIEAEAAPLEAIANTFLKKAASFSQKMGGVLGLDKSKAITNKTEAYVKEAEGLQRQVYEIQQEYSRKRMSKDDEELQAIRDKFKKLADEIGKFNKNPKNKLKVDGSGLDATRDKAIEDVTFRQNTEKLKLELDKQKGLYAEYEEYKNNFGETAAKERYKKELDTNKSYIELVQEEYSKLASKQTASLTGGETERLEYLSKTLQLATKDKQKADDDAYKNAMLAGQTYVDKLLQIEKDYQQKVKALKDGGGLTTGRLNVLQEEKQKAIDNVKDEALQKTSIYKKLAIDSVEITREQVKAQLAIVQELLTNSDIELPKELRERLEKELGDFQLVMKLGVDQANLEQLKERFRDLVAQIGLVDEFGQSLLSEPERKRVMQALTEIRQKIKEVDATGDGKVSWADKVTKSFAYLEGSTEEVARGLAKDLGSLSGSFGSLANEVGQYNTELGSTLKSIAQFVNIGASAAQSVAGFASGDIISGINGALGAIGGIVAYVSNLDFQYDQFYKNIIEGERKYREALLARQILEAQANPIKYKALASEFKLLTSQVKQYNEEYAKIFSDLQFQTYVDYVEKEKAFWITIDTHDILASLKGKTFEELKQLLAEDRLRGKTKEMVERLVELEQKGYDAQKALNDLAKQMAELFTGTTADALTDSLLQLFKEGKTGVQDLADFFEQTMKDAALSIFKNKVLAEAMEKFYAEFSKATEGGSLDSGKIASLKLLFDSLVQGANTQFDALQQITGLNLVSSGGSASTNNSSLAGQIQRSVTEATASELAGLARSYYDISKKNYGVGIDSLTVIRQNASYLLSIQNNTEATVKRLDDVVTELKTVSKNTKSSNSAYDNGW